MSCFHLCSKPAPQTLPEGFSLMYNTWDSSAIPRLRHTTVNWQMLNQARMTQLLEANSEGGTSLRPKISRQNPGVYSPEETGLWMIVNHKKAITWSHQCVIITLKCQLAEKEILFCVLLVPLKWNLSHHHSTAVQLLPRGWNRGHPSAPATHTHIHTRSHTHPWTIRTLDQTPIETQGISRTCRAQGGRCKPGSGFPNPFLSQFLV